MTETLDVLLSEHPIAQLRRDGVEDYTLEYRPEWTDAENAVPLSLSLPLGSRRHRGRTVADYLDNLLPDDPEVRQRWATDAGLDTVEPFFLLREYGQDVAGAASFRPEGSPAVGGRRPMSSDDVADRIRVIREDDAAWHDELVDVAGQFSLGGAQSKFSLARHDDRWFETTGSDASTHLFKPQVTGVRDGELIEYLVMRTAYLLGIPTARVELFDHDEQHSLVVERFDRRTEGPSTVRLHQEDLLQALGRPRLLKFEKHGGPGIDDIAGLLAAQADRDSRRRYATMLFFSWIVLSTDAHAKNFSIFIEPDGARLTPLYDASSVIPYLGPDRLLDLPSLLDRAGDRNLAVRYGASYLARDVARFELGVVARRCGLPGDELLALVAAQLIDISDVMAEVASTMPPRLQTDIVARAVEWMPVRARQAAEQLGIGTLL
ncbi:HipA domain-containing protein [Herbiconiux sp. CPCC 205716]|uniref:HipA domain-containing protein n=1 Tax=Herbiconiux gentiana TaxID=2970912 RepID=A0ABT2GEV4_9MICO|nr:HipA domain-containing protein [Herbiconiux gentiana]MCS5714749.1 HipA domain-containing protein [Herbiconiux gentiana]